MRLLLIESWRFSLILLAITITMVVVAIIIQKILDINQFSDKDGEKERMNFYEQNH